MGTNYYLMVNVCPTCKHPENQYHIGKSSMGWSFTFQALKGYESPTGAPINSAKDWRDAMSMKINGKRVRIMSEYKRPISAKKFWEMVDEKKQGKNHHTETTGGPRQLWKDDRSWIDAEGHAFCTGYFS
jgi:hypothetical protein